MLTREEDGGFWPNLEFATYRYRKRILRQKFRRCQFHRGSNSFFGYNAGASTTSGS